MRVSRFAKKNDATVLTWQCVGYHLLVVAGLSLLLWQSWISLLAASAFLPLVLRTIAGLKEEKGKLSLKRIGMAESVYTLVFVVFLVWGLKPVIMA